jgi:nitric oxide reductase NorD protein
MAVHLADYQAILDELDEHITEVLEATWHDAARVLSPRGLEGYVHGASSLKSLGRGNELVIAFIESAPLVAREIGEDAVAELLSAAIKMFSKTSAEVISLMFSTASTAAARLGELELFKGYLQLLDTLLAQAPRALRPMLENLDRLLGQLTLGGLRRWAMWGVSAHRTNFEGQARYFSLQSPESQTVLQKEQRGTLFIDVQRRLIIYLRALWARDFYLRPTSGDFETREGYRPYIESYFIHLPDAFDDYPLESGEVVPGLAIYRASAAHCAAHMVYSQPYGEAGEELSPLQQALVGLIEDARVEHLAIKLFPGLKPLWLPLLPTDPQAEESLGPLLDRMARALLDEDYADSHPLVNSARARLGELKEQLDDPKIACEIGLALAQQALERGISYNSRDDVLSSPYRDDNRYLWWKEEAENGRHLLPGQNGQVRKYVSVMQMINAVDVPFAGDDAQEIWILNTPLFDDDGTTFNEREGKPPVSSPVHYHEWDYQTQLERPQWVTLLEKRPQRGDAAIIEAVVEKHKPLVRRLKYLIEAMQPQGVVRLRKQEDGDEIDLNAAIEAMVEIKMGHMPDPRIGIRTQLQIRDLAVLLLIDLSESTNDAVREAETETTVLDLAREAAALLADALAKIGDPFAIHGFDSNGRHDVEYYRFKDFDTPYDEQAKARLAGMTGQLSTRMGAALRHGGSLLARQPHHKKLLLLLSDGEPADNDVRDPQYLRYDTKKAVEELARKGVHTFCLTLDPYADQYVSRIFGAKNYMILDHVTRLPEKLPALYMGLTR